MINRRDMLMLGLTAPFLHACGGGGGDAPPGARDDRVVDTAIKADDWSVGSPESQGVAPAAMDLLLKDGAAMPTLKAVLVVRNGQLIGEQYYGGTKSSDLLHIRSATKTVSSLLIGQAIAEGKLPGVAATVKTLLPRELALVPGSAAGDVPLMRLLQMRGGLVWNENAQMQAIMDAPDLTHMALNRAATGATRWEYDSASSHLPSPILANAYGMDALSVATRTLFEPLGIRQAAWSRDGKGVNQGSYGLQLRPRDLMKIAWMSFDSGNWQGRQVVPAAWLQESLASHVQLSSEPGSALTRIGYGYLWWTGMLGGQAVQLAWGFGGQFAILVPGLRMSIVTAAQWNIAIDQGSANELTILGLVGKFIASVKPA